MMEWYMRNHRQYKSKKEERMRIPGPTADAIKSMDHYLRPLPFLRMLKLGATEYSLLMSLVSSGLALLPH